MKTLLLRGALFALALMGPVASPGAEITSRKDVLRLASRVADWQLERMGATHGVTKFAEETANPRSWQQGAFWVGMTHLADVTGEKRFADAIIAMGKANQWQPGKRTYPCRRSRHCPKLPVVGAARCGYRGDRAGARDIRFHPRQTAHRSPELRASQGLRIDALPAALVLV